MLVFWKWWVRFFPASRTGRASLTTRQLEPSVVKWITFLNPACVKFTLARNNNIFINMLMMTQQTFQSSCNHGINMKII